MSNQKQPAVLVMRAVTEFRFRKKRFGLVDERGKLVDQLIDEDRYTKTAITGDKIDVASDDLTEKLFFSTVNIGVQREAISDFKQFGAAITQLSNNQHVQGALESTEIIRVGTKASIFYYRKGLGSYEQIKRFYKEGFIEDSVKFDKALGGSVNDTIYNFDFTKSDKKGHLQIAPITKDQFVNQIVQDPVVYNKPGVIKAEYGLLFDIDIYDDTLDGVTYPNSPTIAKECWKEVEEVFKNLLKLISGDNYGK